jgi:hypothetical protein
MLWKPRRPRRRTVAPTPRLHLAATPQAMSSTATATSALPRLGQPSPPPPPPAPPPLSPAHPRYRPGARCWCYRQLVPVPVPRSPSVCAAVANLARRLATTNRSRRHCSSSPCTRPPTTAARRRGRGGSPAAHYQRAASSCCWRLHRRWCDISVLTQDGGAEGG